MTVVREAVGRPCSACPWLTSNQGVRHPGGWYTKRNLARLWAGLRRGEFMSCHKTDVRNPVPAGVRPPPATARATECTGALIVQQREFMRVQEMVDAGLDLRDAIRAAPRGITMSGMRVLFERSLRIPGDVPMARPDLNAPGVGRPGEPPWRPR